jgi:hypothetical protein
VKEAFAKAYLTVLEAIHEYLMKKGLTKKELPKSVDVYRKALQKYLAVDGGKLLREFEKPYDPLPIAGYYRGLIYDVEAVKAHMNAAREFREFIDKIS